MSIDIEDRDGTRRGFRFDGKQIAFFDLDEKVDATAEKSGDLDTAFAYFTQGLQMPLPMGELFTNNLPTGLKDRVSEASFVAEETIGGKRSRSGVASSGSLGSNRAAGAGSYSRSGAASSGSWQGNRAEAQTGRQAAASQRQASGAQAQASREAAAGQRQSAATQNQQTRQSAAGERQSGRQAQQDQLQGNRYQQQNQNREDWQDYADDHYYGRGYYPGYPTGRVAAGMAVGATMTAAAFNAQKASCKSLVVNGMSYYQCGSTWYQPSYRGAM